MRDYRPVMLTAEQATAQAASHPAPPVTASKIRRLRLLATDANPKIRESAASSYHTPADVFEVLARDPDQGVRGCVARNEYAPCDVLRTLAADPAEQVRGFLALNYFVPGDVMLQLASDSSSTVRGLVEWKASVADNELAV